MKKKILITGGAGLIGSILIKKLGSKFDFSSLDIKKVKGLKSHVDWNAWSVPEIFLEIQRQGNMDELEMRRVFNLGIGYCVIVPANRVELTMNIIKSESIDCWEIGEVYAE